MTDKKVEPLREGSIKRGGINPPPSSPKPQYHPPAQKANSNQGQDAGGGKRSSASD